MNKKKNTVCFLIAFALLIFALIFSMRFGSVSLSWREFCGGLFSKDGYERISFILWNLRFPRMLACVLAGIGLSVSGLALQTITGNDLAGPNIIGVNAGAGFFVIAGMFFLPDSSGFFPVFAFAGAFFTTALILLIASALQSGKSRIILSGIAVTALLNAGISLIARLDTDLLSIYNDFSVGGLNVTDPGKLFAPMIMILASAIVCIFFSKDMDAMLLGDSLSRALGVNVRFVRFLVILAASASAGAVVSFAGLLGFVGLIVPHMARRIFGIRTKTALYSSAVLGAIVVLLADTLGRSVFPGTEIPVGIVMAFIGVPFFLYLIIRRRPV